MYKILKKFRGYTENRVFEIEEEFDFSDERAVEITDKLGDGFLEKLKEDIESENVELLPTESNTVAEIKTYLTDKQIDFDDKAKKADLLLLIK
ncbi:hypothetical protein KIJ05_07705 [Leuconostoc gelidum subsp. gasicomitatum]|uniref:HeH/LEM domain-containing protein n=1 Tax=Leuconostoc gasicomitatum TaxID=115778 RepID=UPI001CC5878D|nr:HeH/LEM domain-containing protein [Leuconostoc gasicomitatum]MBZ5985001.1 hypothetical protein [Leuconostoc gasicomitatum]